MRPTHEQEALVALLFVTWMILFGVIAFWAMHP